MNVYKALETARPTARLVAVIEPARHPNAVRKWEIWWASGRGGDWFGLLADAMGFVRRFYPEVRFEKQELPDRAENFRIDIAKRQRKVR